MRLQACRGPPMMNCCILIVPTMSTFWSFTAAYSAKNMTDALVVHSYAAPTAFSPKAFQYYLPAYLIWLLNNPDSMDYAGEATLLALDPATDKEMLHAFRKSKFSLMTGAQVSVIRDFLHRLAKHPDLGELAENALINYWLDAPGT